MSDQSKSVPDPATSYERAKPKQQSPSGQLADPHAKPPKKADELQKGNKEPAHPRHEKSE